MPFASHEIENKKFVVALRGYATNEVDAFLRAVAADYKSLLDGAHEPIALAELETVMRAALEEADAITSRAEEEAAEVRRSAEEDALLVRQTAAAQLVELRKAERWADMKLEQVERRTAELRRVESRLQRQRFSSQLSEAVAEGNAA
jgi:DivIVA domain-containing protein